jgi:PIN domain nuclease of toxin-antitoxin system
LRLLLDTHVALWAVTDSPRLSIKARKLIEDLNNEIFVSTVSIWEIAIKRSLARQRPGDFPITTSAALIAFSEAGYTMLSITPTHAAAVEALPALHGDPFDRMLVAQSLTEPLRLLTADPQILAYGESAIAA